MVRRNFLNVVLDEVLSTGSGHYADKVDMEACIALREGNEGHWQREYGRN